ncbi:MAG: hypothetical protein CBD74_06000 [Saprospirales bacterium TMED214]|nr:MAG: hypothetical protein CBD74_06000 [Saprospirales bacterium TMED214]
MRLAGSDNIFHELSAYSKAADPGDCVEGVIEQIEILRAKGLGSSAAIEHGLNIWEGKEDAVSASPRFAAIYGDGPSDNSTVTSVSSQPDQGV